MPSKRTFVLGLGLVVLGVRQTRAADEFGSLYQQVLAEPDLIEAAKSERDGQEVEFQLRTNREFEAQVRTFVQHIKGSQHPISQKAQDLILLFEITNAANYTRKYQRPIWPNGDSGVTVGVGYDLGFIRPEWLQEDWGSFISPQSLKALTPACGLRAGEADRFCQSAPPVVIPWTVAHAQFQQVLLPRYVAETLIHLPQADCLSNDALGALVSLVYNRGASFTSQGPRYLEMREIRTAAIQSDWESVPGLIQSMAHLWEGKPSMRGLVLRRRMEAAQFRAGLAGSRC